MNKTAPYLSVVIPVFNEQENIEELVSRLHKVMAEIGRPYEMIFVDDGSSDNSLRLLRQCQSTIPQMTVIEFNRNYGQHAAIFSGFDKSAGEVIITLDADLQNPPEEIPKLVRKMEEGFDTVATIREKRQDSLFRRSASYLINRITSRITGVKLRDYGCMLRAYRRKIVEAMCASKEISTFIPALAISYAKHVAEINVQHTLRHRGKSKYSLLRLIALQFDLMTSFSLWPLRLFIFLGVIIAASGIGFGTFLLLMRLIKGPEWAVSGVFTLFAILFFFVGAQFLAFGLLGEYIGRIYAEVRRRPRFIINQTYASEGEPK